MAGSLLDKKNLEAICRELDEAEAERLADPVKYACKMAVELDGIYRPTFLKLELGATEGLLFYDDWVIDSNGTITDIVHVCDAEDKFYSPTVMTRKKPKYGNRRDSQVSKYDNTYIEDRLVWDLVCVTCGSKPPQGLDGLIELLLKRKENMNGGDESPNMG